MKSWINASNKPLSSIEWLTTHHKAKINERKQFLKTVVQDTDRAIIDIGCGPGLWLDLLNNIAHSNCKFIGVDTDELALKHARSITNCWKRDVEYLNIDFEKNVDLIPKADLIFIFNVFPFMNNPLLFLNSIKSKLKKNGRIVIRQYDGGTIRFGPMDESLRQKLNASLYSSIGVSKLFHHYDLDRVYSVIKSSNFSSKNIDFELFSKVSSYSNDFRKYIEATIEWNLKHVGNSIEVELLEWYNNEFINYSYFVGVDLVAIIS